MDTRENYSEKFSLKSLVVYLCKHYKGICLAAVLGMAALSALNVIKGQNYSDTITETDVISAEELEKSKNDLKIAQNSLESAKGKLESQKVLLAENEDSLAEYEAQWKADINTQTKYEDRYGVTTVYRLKGKDELAVDQTLNSIGAAFESMYDELAPQVKGEELTSYNFQRLFTVGVNLNQNQVSIKTSFETKEGLAQIIDLYHAWMDTKVKEHQAEYPEAELELDISEENEYVYFDSTIFNDQRAVADKRIAIQNSITSINTAITATQNELITTEATIKELTDEIEKNEKLWDNTVVLPGQRLVSKTSVIIYLILGAVVGILFGAVFYSFRYMYGRKLRDTDDMRCRTGEYVIGTLYSPVYPKKGQFQRKLDRWNGVYEITDMEKQIERLAVDISIQLRKFKKKDIMLTGTVELPVLTELGNKLSAFMEGISIRTGENPVYSLETARDMAEAEAVITVEKIGTSQVAEIQKLRDYLRNSHIQVLGGITV